MSDTLDDVIGALDRQLSVVRAQMVALSSRRSRLETALAVLLENAAPSPTTPTDTERKDAGNE
jgi:hypothetical protein